MSEKQAVSGGLVLVRCYRQLQPGREVRVRWPRRDALTSPAGSPIWEWRSAVVVSTQRRLARVVLDSGGWVDLKRLKDVRLVRVRKRPAAAAPPQGPAPGPTTSAQEPAL